MQKFQDRDLYKGVIQGFHGKSFNALETKN